MAPRRFPVTVNPMTPNKRTPLLVLYGIAAGCLLLAQFVNWFQVSFGGFSAGFNAWTVNGSAGGFGSSSETWMSGLGDEGSTWQSTLMAFAGPLVLAGTVLAGLCIMTIMQNKVPQTRRLGTIAGICAAVATLFGFLFNYTQDGDGMDFYFGALFPIAGTVLAFVATGMLNSYTAGTVPGPTTPQSRPPVQP